jgi:hypothetical protein
MNEVEDWLRALQAPVPLRAVAEPKAMATPRQIALQSSVHGTLLEALLWLRVGIIDPAHVLVQDGRNDLERYLHGVVHRLEGDFWNAKYWFRQVRNRELILFVENCIRNKLEELELLESAQQMKLIEASDFTPSRFVDQCESFLASAQSTQTSNLSKILESIGQAEWTALWSFIGNQKTAQRG